MLRKSASMYLCREQGGADSGQGGSLVASFSARWCLRQPRSQPESIIRSGHAGRQCQRLVSTKSRVRGKGLDDALRRHAREDGDEGLAGRGRCECEEDVRHKRHDATLGEKLRSGRECVCRRWRWRSRVEQRLGLGTLLEPPHSRARRGGAGRAEQGRDENKNREAAHFIGDVAV